MRFIINTKKKKKRYPNSLNIAKKKLNKTTPKTYIKIKLDIK
jgi:hypothetical protein